MNASTRWIDDGGVLVRFAGPRLAAADDDLVPVRLRRGGRMLGGSLSWEQPQQLAAFSRDSPFNGMTVPGDVTVSRQVLAEPDADLSDHTWATLGDGTPLVTAARRGKGMIVLFHVTADTRWSDLPLSGAFVDMLKRIVGLSGAPPRPRPMPRPAPRAPPATRCRRPACSTASAPSSRRRLPRGRFPPALPVAPPPTIRPASTARRKALSPSTRWTPADRLAPIDFCRSMPRLDYFRTCEPQDLRGPVFLAALALLLIDALVVFWLAGGIYRLLPRRGIAAGMLLAAGIGSARLGSVRPPVPRPSHRATIRRAGDARNPSRLCGDRRQRDGRCQQVRADRA